MRVTKMESTKSRLVMHIKDIGRRKGDQKGKRPGDSRARKDQSRRVDPEKFG